MAVTIADRVWCRNHFAAMADGGRWGVPRSGLIFKREGATLVLVERMPWTDELAEAAGAGRDVPVDADALRAYQDADAALILRTFREAGIATRNDIGGTP